MEWTTNAAHSIGLLCTWITGCSKPAKCRELCGPRSCCLCGLVRNVVRMHSSGCTASSKLLIACSALLLAVVYDDADCSVVLVAVPVLGGCANYTWQMVALICCITFNAGQVSSLRMALVTHLFHTRKSRYDCCGIKAIAEKFVRSNRELKQAQRNEIKRRGGRQK